MNVSEDDRKRTAHHVKGLTGLTPIIVSVFLAACGGGGSGSTTDVTVTLSAAAPESLVGESVAISWQSANSTQCVLSGLPNGASATVATNGSQSLAFSTAGNQTLRIDCDNSIKSATATVSLAVQNVSTYSVPTDLTKLSYPQSYTRPSTKIAEINRDPCKLDVDFVSYPQTWIGSRPLPTVEGAPLRADIGRGISVKDIYLPDNPAFVASGAPGAPNGCKGSLRAEFQRTLARIKAVGGNHTWITQWRWIFPRPDGSWRFTTPEETYGSTPDSELAFFVSEAHKLGIKVMVTNQIQGMVDSLNGTPYMPAANMDNFRKWFGAFQAHIAERAPVFQAMGVDYWELTCNACVYGDNGDNSSAAKALFAAEYEKALTKMRESFLGKTWAHYSPWLSEVKPEMIARLDLLATGFWLNTMTNSYSESLTVSSFRQALHDSGAVSGMEFVASLGRPLLVNLDIVQSRKDAFTQPGYLEETGCIATWGSLVAGGTGACIQRDFVADFGIQAIAAEGYLRTLKTINLPVGSIVTGGQYWVTDSVMPATAFPNLGTTIRNKPAEGIVKAWFAK